MARHLPYIIEEKTYHGGEFDVVDVPHQSLISWLRNLVVLEGPCRSSWAFSELRSKTAHLALSTSVSDIYTVAEGRGASIRTAHPFARCQMIGIAAVDEEIEQVPASRSEYDCQCYAAVQMFRRTDLCKRSPLSCEMPPGLGRRLPIRNFRTPYCGTDNILV
jgi:hypothetical protein